MCHQTGARKHPHRQRSEDRRARKGARSAATARGGAATGQDTTVARTVAAENGGGCNIGAVSTTTALV